MDGVRVGSVADIPKSTKVRNLHFNHDLLKKANELLKKGLRLSLPNQEKTVLVDALKDPYALPEVFAEPDLVRSSYFYHRARSQIVEKYRGVRRAIADISGLNRRCYGYRRAHASPFKQHVFISEKVVQRLMTPECLVVSAPRWQRHGSHLGAISLAPGNPINRNFHAATPNGERLTDITEF